jgi:hypothetical protein
LTELSREAGRTLFYRANPDRWALHKLGFEGIKYRGRAELEQWLEEHPNEHMWARAQMAAGRLTLDAGRSYQDEALQMVSEPGRYILRFPNGAGKTALLAILVLWFLDNYPDGAVVTTAGTWSQIRDQLWREIPFWAAKVLDPEDVVWTPKDLQKTGINVSDKWYAIGRTASKEHTFEGIHSKYVLVIFDEAKAVKSDIWDAARRILRGRGVFDVKLWWIVASTPASPFGAYYDATQSSLWTEFKISAYESQMIGMDEIQADLEELGEDGPLFWSMDLAEFPHEGEDTVISLSSILPCIEGTEIAERAKELSKKLNLYSGVDIARYGQDESCQVFAQGGWVRAIETWDRKPLTWSSQKVHRNLQDWNMFPQRVLVDDTGIGGAVTDYLADHGWEPIAINHQARAPHNTRYANWITEAWFTMRDLFRDQLICIPDDRVLINQLAGRKYEQDGKDRLRIESKRVMKKDGRRSPDRAEATIYATTAEEMAGHLLATEMPVTPGFSNFLRGW